MLHYKEHGKEKRIPHSSFLQDVRSSSGPFWGGLSAFLGLPFNRTFHSRPTSRNPPTKVKTKDSNRHFPTHPALHILGSYRNPAAPTRPPLPPPKATTILARPRFAYPPKRGCNRPPCYIPSVFLPFPGPRKGGKGETHRKNSFLYLSGSVVIDCSGNSFPAAFIILGISCSMFQKKSSKAIL